MQCERTAPVGVSDFIFKDFTTIFIQSLFLKFSFFFAFLFSFFRLFISVNVAAVPVTTQVNGGSVYGLLRYFVKFFFAHQFKIF